MSPCYLVSTDTYLPFENENSETKRILAAEFDGFIAVISSLMGVTSSVNHFDWILVVYTLKVDPAMQLLDE